MKICVLKRTQYAAIRDVARKDGWIKVRFDTYLSWKDYNYLRRNHVQMEKLAREGALVQVIMYGWTEKADMREK